MRSRFIHLIRTDWNGFLCALSNIPLCVCATLLYPFTYDAHLGCVHVLAIVNSAAMNIRVHASFSIFVSSGYMPRSRIAGHDGGFTPSFFKGSPYCLPKWLYQFSFPLTVQEGFLFSMSVPTFIVCRLSDCCEVVSHYGFDVHFSNNEWRWASSHVLDSGL